MILSEWCIYTYIYPVNFGEMMNAKTIEEPIVIIHCKMVFINKI